MLWRVSVNMCPKSKRSFSKLSITATLTSRPTNLLAAIVDQINTEVVISFQIYFDTEAFSLKHKYAKLVPEAYADKDNIKKHLREGEGELSIGQDKASVRVSI